MRHAGLYSGILTALTVLVIISLGGGIWGAEQSIGHWTGNLLQGVCHQMPDRSFTVNGVPMAVNSRCFGIFGGLLAGWLIIPVLHKLKTKNDLTLWFLLVAVIIQIADYSGNMIGLWVNTNLSRVILGFLLGFAVSATISELFKSKK